MSRSRKHTPIWGFAKSERDDKKILHGKLRAKLRVAVRKMLLEHSSEKYIAPKYDEVHNKWVMAKDGKSYWFPNKSGIWLCFEKMMRK